ncbi:hypothetical protein BH10BAC3_BH10BAC3_04100 [soil metagenome]
MEKNIFILFMLVIVLALLTIAAVSYLYITAKNKERMALIEKGLNPNLARSDFWIQVGLIAGGIGAGLMFGDIVNSNYGPLFAILFAGAGLVVYNITRKAKMKEN